MRTKACHLFLPLLVLMGLQMCLSAAEWREALPGWKYEFPRDHRIHPDFKTEWWYFTGRLTGEKGEVFGYQLTFFRQGLLAPSRRGQATSRFVVDDLKFAHFAVSDVGAQRFYFQQKLARGAFGEAGFGTERLAWIDDWVLDLRADGSFAVRAKDGSTTLVLDLTSAKPWVIHGENGVSQKATGAGHASPYYSATRLRARGTLTIGGKALAVTGESWLDREWASNQLTAEQLGWNWFSIQFDDGSELMLYQMRVKGGGVDPNSSATWVTPEGQARHLKRDEYQLKPTKEWTSKATGGRYPIAWEMTVPSLKLEARISTPLAGQELVLQPVAYWEGLIGVEGSREGKPVRGHGYMELTGYAGALVGLQATEPK